MQQEAGTGKREGTLSARQLILVFFGGVAVCGVFFALGFLVGYSERNAGTVVEEVKPGGTIPAPYNPPPAPAEAARGSSPAARPGNVALSYEAVVGKENPTPNLEKPKVKAAQGTAAPSSPAPSPTAAAEVPSGFTVQVAALPQLKDAEQMVETLKKKGYAVFMVAPEYAHANDNFYRVQVGPFRTRQEAEAMRDRLASEGFKPFIRK